MAAQTLFVGTQKGLFRLRSDADRAHWSMDGPHMPGYEIIHLCVSPADPSIVYAAARHSVWGAHVYRSTDGGDSWDALEAAPHHPPGTRPSSLKAIWFLAASPDGTRLYAGIDPAGLFTSEDGAASWAAVESLNDHPTRDTWEPAKGGFSLHSIYVDPREPSNVYCGISAGGVYRSTDGGASWSPANQGVRAENLPNRYPESGHNVHRLVMHPGRPERLYRQCYNGTYRSDDGARSWTEITEGLPGDFGYAITVHPGEPDTVFQIPESGAHLRTVVDGRLRVFVSRDAGASWASCSDGLPRENAWITVLREAMDTDDQDPCGVYFGTSGGHLFASRDEAGSWQQVAGYLPRILCVRAV
ncbi:MAG: hypothetical protein P8080_09120 [Gammaproteobacteria bacterium]